MKRYNYSQMKKLYKTELEENSTEADWKREKHMIDQEQGNTFKTTKPTSGLSSQELYNLSSLAP